MSLPNANCGLFAGLVGPGEAVSRGRIYNKKQSFEQQLINRFRFLQKKVTWPKFVTNNQRIADSIRNCCKRLELMLKQELEGIVKLMI